MRLICIMNGPFVKDRKDSLTGLILWMLSICGRHTIGVQMTGEHRPAVAVIYVGSDTHICQFPFSITILTFVLHFGFID